MILSSPLPTITSLLLLCHFQYQLQYHDAGGGGVSRILVSELVVVSFITSQILIIIT